MIFLNKKKNSLVRYDDMRKPSVTNCDKTNTLSECMVHCKCIYQMVGTSELISLENVIKSKVLY